MTPIHSRRYLPQVFAFFEQSPADLTCDSQMLTCLLYLLTDRLVCPPDDGQHDLDLRD